MLALTQNGDSLMYIVHDIVMGAPMQTAHCFVVKESYIGLYELPEDRCFMFDFGEDEKAHLFIYDTDFGYDAGHITIPTRRTIFSRSAGSAESLKLYRVTVRTDKIRWDIYSDHLKIRTFET